MTTPTSYLADIESQEENDFVAGVAIAGNAGRSKLFMFEAECLESFNLVSLTGLIDEMHSCFLFLTNNYVEFCLARRCAVE